jgi:hypothetical protein
LTGEILQQHPSRSSFIRTMSSSNGLQKPPTIKGKIWSHQTALSRTIAGRAPSDPKGKGREGLEEDTELPPPLAPGMSPLCIRRMILSQLTHLRSRSVRAPGTRMNHPLMSHPTLLFL